MLKKITIYIETDNSRIPESEWNDRFIQEIIRQELDNLSPYGYVKGWSIEDIDKPVSCSR
jgi:hypothetical protein